MYVDLFKPEVKHPYRRCPNRLEQQIRALPGSVECILIDEVHRLDPLLGSQAKSPKSRAEGVVPLPVVVSNSDSMRSVHLMRQLVHCHIRRRSPGVRQKIDVLRRPIDVQGTRWTRAIFVELCNDSVEIAVKRIAWNVITLLAPVEVSSKGSENHPRVTSSLAQRDCHWTLIALVWPSARYVILPQRHGVALPAHVQRPRALSPEFAQWARLVLANLHWFRASTS